MTKPVFASQRRCFWGDCPNESKDLTLMRCSRCKSAIYCSTSCQKKDWSRHKIVCIGKSNLQKDEGTASVMMNLVEKSFLCVNKNEQLMKSIKEAEARLAQISEKLGASEARLNGERIFREAQKCNREMLVPDWSRLDMSNPLAIFPRSIEDGFKKLESLKEEAERLIEEYSKKKPPSLDHLSNGEKEELLFKTINDNIYQIEVVSDRILFLISNGCGLVDGKFSERVKQKVQLINDSNLQLEINVLISMKSGLFS
ncbi:MAG: hypothetical protein K1060chlam5_01225 [Candidatus Anoxychlamydiales bacterium]|nr:hypothetical protein [Candidatus Anoxychlamydiales bacterium]